MDKIPIYKGCTNLQCYCDNSCKEIIGYREKTLVETMTSSVVKLEPKPKLEKIINKNYAN